MPLEYDEHILVTPEDKTLEMYHLQEKQTGQYMCKLGTALTAPYFLSVVNNTENVNIVHTVFAAEGPYPENPKYIAEHNLLLSTKWGPWSPCSKCGNIGKRHRLGYCIIELQQGRNRDTTFNEIGMDISININILTLKMSMKKNYKKKV